MNLYGRLAAELHGNQGNNRVKISEIFTHHGEKYASPKEAIDYR
jgi:hypothetical protein